MKNDYGILEIIWRGSILFRFKDEVSRNKFLKEYIEFFWDLEETPRQLGLAGTFIDPHWEAQHDDAYLQLSIHEAHTSGSVPKKIVIKGKNGDDVVWEISLFSELEKRFSGKNVMQAKKVN